MRIAVVKNSLVFKKLNKFSVKYPRGTFDIINVTDGEGYIEQIRISKKPDIVFINVSASGLNVEVFELCKKIKTQYFSDNIKIICLINDADSEIIIKKIIDYGADDYVSEFTEIYSLLAKIIRII